MSECVRACVRAGAPAGFLPRVRPGGGVDGCH